MSDQAPGENRPGAPGENRPGGRPAWSDLGNGVLVRRSRLYQMNSVLLLDEKHAIVVDPGVLPSEIEEIAALVREARPRSSTLFLTHAHWDHVLGLPWFPEASILAHDRFGEETHEGLAHITEEANRVALEAGERWPVEFAPFHADVAVSGLRVMLLGPWRVVLRDAPGHSDSQLTLHVPELRLLIAADMLSDIEIPLLNRPPEVYRRTLEALLPVAEGGAIETLIPGHGRVAEGRDAVLGRLRRDLAYLARLESGVRTARSKRQSLAQAQDVMADWDDVERDPGTPMRAAHLENVKFAWEVAAPAKR